MHRAHNRTALVLRSNNDCRAVGQARQQAAGVEQHLLELAVGMGEEGLDLLALHRREGADVGQLVDEEPVPLVRGDATGAGMRLGEVAVSFEHRHLVAHRRRRHVEAVLARHTVRADRLGGLDVLLHHGLQDRRLPVIQHLALKCTECQPR